MRTDNQSGLIGFIAMLRGAARGIVAGLLALSMLSITAVSSAAVFPMPPAGSNIIGNLQVVTITENNKSTLLDIARHYNIGQDEIVAANPDVSAWKPKVGSKVVIPSEYILPPGPYEGIVVNIPQRRLFYFIPKTKDKPAQVITYPVSISRPGWETPLGLTRIVGKHKDPAWFPPQSVREERRRDGEKNFPTYFPPGPDNPMGMLALQTGFSQIFIHGTNKPWGVGMRMSHGCINLYPEDAADLFPRVTTGTPVRFINEPQTVGIRDGKVYLSSAEAVSEYVSKLSSVQRAVAALNPYTNMRGAECPYDEIDCASLTTAATAYRFLPVPVSLDAPDLEQRIAMLQPEPYTAEPYGESGNDAMPPVRKTAEAKPPKSPGQKSGQKSVVKNSQGRTKEKLSANQL